MVLDLEKCHSWEADVWNLHSNGKGKNIYGGKCCKMLTIGEPT